MIFLLISVTFNIVLMIFLLGRFWYIYANLRRCQSMKFWKQHLNPEFRSTSFFIKYFGIFGNTRNILCICCSISLFVLLIIAFAVIVPINIGNINLQSTWPRHGELDHVILTAGTMIAILWLIFFLLLMYFVLSTSYLNRRYFVDF